MADSNCCYRKRDYSNYGAGGAFTGKNWVKLGFTVQGSATRANESATAGWFVPGLSITDAVTVFTF